MKFESIVRQMENPYESPTSVADELPTLRPRRVNFLYVVGTMLGTSFLLTCLVAPKFTMSSDAAALFFGFTALGPFAVFLHEPWIYSSSFAAIAVVVFCAAFLYLVIPRKVTFVISILGGFAWAVLGAFLLLLFA